MKKLLAVVAIIAVAIVAILALVYLPAEARPTECGPEPFCEEGQITVEPAELVARSCTYEMRDKIYKCTGLKQVIHGTNRNVSLFYEKKENDPNHCHRIQWNKLGDAKDTFKRWHPKKANGKPKDHGSWAAAYNHHIKENPSANTSWGDWYSVESCNPERANCRETCIPEHWTDPVCRDPIPGCMDDSANNYNPDAEVDDQSCTYGEQCGRCSNKTPGTYVEWFDRDGGCDDDWYNERVEYPDDKRCVVIQRVCEEEDAYNYGEELPCVYDVCPNLEGLQEEIPEGMVKPGRRCIPKPIKPVDLCDNIEGFQDEVPEGLIYDEAANTCNKPEEKKKKTCDDVMRMWLLWDQFGRECYIISDTHPGVERQQVLCKWACDERPFVAIRAWSGMVDSCNNWELDEYASYPRLHVDDLKKVLSHEYQTEIGGGAEFCPAGG